MVYFLSALCAILAFLYYQAKSRSIVLKAILDEKEKSQELYKKSEAELKESFQSLSFEALNKNNQSFLDLAKKTFDTLHEKSEGNLSKKEAEIKNLVKPMKESLGKLDEHMHQLQKERKVETSTLSEQIKLLMESEARLKEETQSLVKVLKAPDVRGKWGEVQLKRIVELAGMLGHCDFVEQKTFEHEDTIQRPDMIIHMPNERCIAIDAKAPFDAFLEASRAQTDEDREAKMAQHAKQLRSHILALGKKSYFKHFAKSPEFVVLFLPNESFYTAALSADPSLLELGADKGVIMATPSTLIGLLKSVAFGWKQEAISQNAEEVSKLGNELYKRLNDMNKHVIQLGRTLKSATQTYNKTVGSLESRVLVSARKLKELGAGAHEIDLEEPEYIEATPRITEVSKSLPEEREISPDP